jgi:1-acyl-sn-glycerol-3-phosphate acyltransferase
MSAPPAPPPLPLRLLYAGYAWPAFLLQAMVALLLLLLLPRLTQRRRLVRWVARNALRSIGMRIDIHGLAALPHPCVVVANHESYLDGVVLAATLPPHFGFVIKREMRSMPAAGWLLERIGAQFVARNNSRGSARDALRVLRSAANGEALAFFPEGTFKPQPGLLPFHNGAFTAAVRAGLPVVPLVLRGTRRRLPPGTLLPWPGKISLTALNPIAATHRESDVGALRDATRALFIEQLKVR